jgi:hypothetical protein
MRYDDPRRLAPRVTLRGLCGVVNRGDLRHAAMVDLSASGIRLERPFDPAEARRTVQLEIEVPDVDEVIWAQGHVTFAHLRPMGGVHPNGQPRLWCQAGIALDSASSRDLRLLRDAVVERWRRERQAADEARRQQLSDLLAA